MNASDPDLATLRQALAAAEQARDEAQARLAAREEGWLVERRDAQFRMRNMLAVIRAIARMTAEDVATVEDYRGILDGRLSSYFRVQAAATSNWQDGLDLETLIADELLRFRLDVGPNVRLGGPPVRVTGKAAGLLSLAFHDLASDTMLHGGPDQDGTTLAIDWRVSAADDADGRTMLTIDWTDDGVQAIDPEAASRWSEWVRQAIAHQLSGSLTTVAQGAMRFARLCLPLACYVAEG